MDKKRTIFYILGIIIIIFLAYFISSFVYVQKRQEKKITKEEVYKVEKQDVHLKLYRINQLFFLKVPDNLIQLDSETLKQKYGNTDRPELVFSSADDSTHIFITMNNLNIKDEEISSYLETKKKEFAAYRVDEIKTYQRFGKTFARIAASQDIDNGKYYDIRYFSLNDQLVTVEFNTLQYKKPDWVTISKDALDSICFDEEDTKKK